MLCVLLPMGLGQESWRVDGSRCCRKRLLVDTSGDWCQVGTCIA
jgi:hypothetical protein